MAKITIAAVGDLLMKGSIIASARRSGNKYSFGPMFAKVSPYLKKPDLTIGNLETTFSGAKLAGPRGKYERRSPRTGYPLFNCPDALAPALKRTGFNVLTTANNHCMDGGAAGLKRTLRVLDQHGLRHTGTFRSLEESRRLLIMRSKGIKVGIAAYTLGTNSIPPPNRWSVNFNRPKKIVADLGRLKKKTDFIVVCLHFGQEYQRAPNRRQKQLAHLLFRHGANAIIGAHPHVLQPVVFKKVKDAHGTVKHRVAAYSLGNFVSSRLGNNNIHTTNGMILRMTVTKNRRGKTDISKISRVHTIVNIRKGKGGTVVRVVPKSRRK